MKIIASEAVQLIAYLKERKAAGDNWVAYPVAGETVAVHSVQCFASAFDANRHCEDINISHVITNEFSANDRSFMSIEMALKAMSEMDKPVAYIGDEKVVRELLNDWQAKPAFLRAEEDLVLDLSLLELSHVILTKRVNPSKEIGQYHLVLHEHAFHPTIYEIGHSHETVLSTGSYEEAFRQLDVQSRKLSPNFQRHYNEIILAGQFRNQPLLLDMEGQPMCNTGVTIATASYGEDGKLVIKFRNSIDKELVLQQDLFAKFDPGQRRLLFYDDHLNLIDPRQTLRSVAAFYMLNAPLEIIEQAKPLSGEISNNPDYDEINIPATGKTFEMKTPDEQLTLDKGTNFLQRLMNKGKRIIGRMNNAGWRKN